VSGSRHSGHNLPLSLVLAIFALFNPKRDSQTTCFLDESEFLDPIALHFDHASSLAFDSLNFAVASSNGYTIIHTVHMLYVLTPNVLGVDDINPDHQLERAT
jgi:hypothetical protein